jgi:hypothetical protein
MKMDSKLLLMIAIVGLGGGCAMFDTSEEDPLPPPAPAKPTTVPAEVDVSTAGGLMHEIFVAFPRRVADMFAGTTPTDAVIRMESPQADVRRSGINNLVDRPFGKQSPYTERYAQIAEFDDNPVVRATAIRALNRSRDGVALRIYTAGLADEDVMVRLESAKALSNVPDAQAIAPLLKTVNTGSENVDVRIAAAEALRHYRSLEVARTLVNLLGERDFGLAWQARQSLRFMTSADQRYDQTAWLNYLSQISWQ